MGLDCSHDAFGGSYSAFNRLRKAVAESVGGSFPPHEDPMMDPKMWYLPDDLDPQENAGIVLFLKHSDYDGCFTPEECSLVARDLEKTLDSLSEKHGGGHIAREGGVRKCVEKFVAGCRAAAEAGENLEFR